MVYQHIKQVYFIGIGGIGMSALARYFKLKGKLVAGYDRTPSPLSKELEEEGIEVVYKEEVEDIPTEFMKDRNSLIIYTPAVQQSHPQLQFFRQEAYDLKKRAVVLGDLTRGHFTLAVAGTHGKTTTSTMLAHILKASGSKVTAFLGGISENYQSNLISAGDEVMVVEADEFDRSFLQLVPNIAAITSMDADHLDIYGEVSKIEESFKQFADLVPEDGELFFSKGLPLTGTSVGIAEKADVSAENICIEKGAYVFDLKYKDDYYEEFRLQLPGKHNLKNAVTALGMALSYGCRPEAARKALASFSGVRRRFTYRLNTSNHVVIDDYAHHPAEIKAVLQAVKEMHPGKKQLAVFQPHLYSRTRDFAEDFAAALNGFDQVVLLDIYPAREEPIPGITSSWLLDKIQHTNKRLVQKEELPQMVKTLQPEVVVLMGAGDISEEVEKITKMLAREN